MRLHYTFVLFTCLPLAMASRLYAQTSVTSWQPVADLLVKRMNLRKGERVLLVGQPGMADSLVPRLRAAIVRAGGVDLGAVSVRGTWPAGWETDFTRRLGEAGAQELAGLAVFTGKGKCIEKSTGTSTDQLAEIETEMEIRQPENATLPSSCAHAHNAM